MDLHPGQQNPQDLYVRPDEADPVRRAFHENKDWYRDLIEHSQDLLCIHDLEGRLLSVNSAPARLLGYSVEEILRIPMRELIAPEYRSQFDAYLNRIESEGEAHGLLVVITRSGERRIWEYSNALRREGIEKPIISGIARDVTEQKRAEKLLREASELYRQIIASAAEGIAVYDRDLRCVAWNPFMEEMIGIPTSEALGKPYHELIPAQVRGHDPGIELNRALQGQTITVPDENLAIAKGGQRWVSSRKAPLRNAQGEIIGVIVTLQDVTERKLAEARLRTSENRYRALYESSPVGVCWVETRTGRFLGVNPKYCEIAGRTEQDLLSRNFQSITAKDDLPENLEKLRRLIEGEVRHYEMEKRYIRPDGSVRWVEVEIVAMWPEGEKADWHMAILQDITARKQAEEDLRRNEQRFRVALAGSPIKVFNQDRNLRYTWVYNLQEGWSESDYLGRTDEEIFGPEIGEQMSAMKRPVLETGQGVRQAFTLTARGKTYYCDITLEPLLDGAGQVEGVNCACVDVTHLREITEELRLAKEKLAEEKLYLEETIDTELGFGEIVGRSSALKRVMGKVAKVASSDATVLLLGETGTGKELVARALHHRSTRQGRSFIKLNCAAIPSGLLESELFGHEKGAFTGAVARKVGRLELADGGTLFLDEIGDIPLSLQPKLLRVLQDMEFERLGGTQTLKVDFRLLAATNRDLLQSVTEREFRSDLYYRLNVFPILIPPLRERREDIRPLVEHFVRKFAVQMKKSITSIPSKTMELLVRWEWPGNIRELENFVERSVILTPGSVLQAPLSELETGVDKGDDSTGTLRDRERDRIIRALRDCHGKLGGADGAAARLGLKRTTLQSKLDHLGIRPATYRT
jgi:formate hydrogenlyase transcriptional activator